jgi:hypothetical protein
MGGTKRDMDGKAPAFCFLPAAIKDEGFCGCEYC